MVRLCPHCGVVDSAYRLTGVRTKPSKKNPEGKERQGLWKCRECRKQFTVRKGTIFEDSHIEMFKWLQAIHLMASRKKHLHRYAAEYKFRYSNRTANGVDDAERGEIAWCAVIGKRLTYQDLTSQHNK